MRRIALYCLVLLALLPLMAARGGGFGRVRHNITRAPDTPAAPKYNKRAASNIQAKLAEPWPLANLADKGPRRYVIYCFRDEAVRDENYCEIEMAIWRWYNQLGYFDGNRQSNLRFYEWKRKVGNHMVPVLCRDGNMQWNHHVPNYALEIFSDESVEGVVTTIGYEPHGEAGRHRMRIGKMHYSQNKLAGIFTHELGHAIGMIHEFQRHDSRLYTKYDCTNVYGYEEALDKAKAENPTEAVAILKKRLCEDFDFAYDIGFIGYEFIIFPEDENHDEPNLLFDYDSVMMYDSTKGADDAEECEFNMNFCPLLKFQNTEFGSPIYDKPMERIHAKTFPSYGDAKFVHRVYVWEP